MTPFPPDSLGNPVPPRQATIDLSPPRRLAGRVVAAKDGPFDVGLASARKILVVKLDFIGDWVLTTPFLAGLRASAPQAEITAVVLDRAFALAAPCRFVDRVVACPAANAGPVRFAAAEEATLRGVVEDFSAGRFDIAIVPRWDADFNGAVRLANASGAPVVVSFSEGCTPGRAAMNAGADALLSLAVLDRRVMHDLETGLELLASLGGMMAGDAPAIDLLPSDRRAADRFIAEAFGSPDAPFLAVAPFAAGRKQWPVERAEDLTRRLAAAFGVGVVAVGSPVQAGEGERFARAVGRGAVNAAGRLGVRDAAAAIARAVALVGMDSSPGHIAAAIGTPAAIFFPNAGSAPAGHVGSPERFRPWAPLARLLILQPPEALHGCAGGCDADATHCIAGIGADDAFSAIAPFLARFAPGRAARIPKAAAGA